MKNWRVVSLAHRALDYVKPYLSHHYKNVRNSVGRSVLTMVSLLSFYLDNNPHDKFCVFRLLGKIFHSDFQLPGVHQVGGPQVADFIMSVVPKLEVLKSLNITVHSSSTGE